MLGGGLEGFGGIEIFDGDEEQTLGRKRGAGAAAIAQGEKFGHIAARQTAAAHVYQSAGEFANHVAQERAAADDVDPLIGAGACDAKAVEGGRGQTFIVATKYFGAKEAALHGAIAIVFIGAGGRSEGSEIVRAFK